MNVIFLTQWYPSPENLVSGIFVREHAMAVAQYHQVYVVFVKGMRPELSTFPQIKPVQDGSLTTYVVTYPHGRIPKTTWLNRIKAVFRVFESLLARNILPDIIHANVHNTSDLAYLLQRRYKIPAVITEQSSEYPRKLFTKCNQIKIRFYMNRLKLIMPVSQDLGSHIQAYGIHAPFEVIPNTVNTDIFYPDNLKLSNQDGIKRILVVALLTKVKGIDYLLQALAIVKHQGIKFFLLVAGDGPDRSELSSLAYRLGISERISFLGNRTKPEIADLMRQADFLALTSRWDNNPVVVLEAMASGIPVLASQIGGIPEVVTSKQGILVKVGDIGDITEKLGYMLLHSQEYSSDQISAYARSRFSYKAIGTSYSAAYDEVIERYRK